MADRPTRGKPSKIDLLPEAIRLELMEMLRNKGISQLDIVEAINEMVEAEGLGDDAKISKSGLNRYASKMEEVGARLRQSREVAEMWSNKLGDKPLSDTNKILREIISHLGFEVSMGMMDGDVASICPKSLNQLALMVQRLEEAAAKGLKREREIQQAFAEQKAQEIEQELRGEDGMSEALESKIFDILLGKQDG